MIMNEWYSSAIAGFVICGATDWNSPFLCRAAIARFDLSKGWWYKACPICFKQLKPKPQSDLLVCPTDDIQNPIAWFKVSLILEDANDKTNAIIIGKSAEELFGITCEELVVNKGFCDQKELLQEMLRVKAQIKLFQLRLGKVKNDTSRNDFLIQTVFEDQAQIHPSNNNKGDETISNLGKKHMVNEMLPSTPPLSVKKSLPSSPTESNSSSKKRQREPIRKTLFTSTPTKKPKSDTTSGYSEETFAFEETNDENVASPDQTPNE